jgi:hypothetical protein
MNKLQEAMAKGREAFRLELERRGPFVFFLTAGAAVVVANLVFADEKRSILRVIIVVVVWLILYPLIGHWRYSKKTKVMPRKP